MARLTLKSVNAAIKAKGINAELVKGDGYFWFDGVDVEFAYSPSVMVFQLNHLTLEQWMEELDAKVQDHKSRL